MKYMFFLLLMVAATASAEIYKWTDANGNVHFGDDPRDRTDAVAVNVETNTYEAVTYQAVDFSNPDHTRRVVMYATAWCGYCAKARKYFKEQNITYVEYDIDKDERAKRMYDLLGGKGVPVILVGKKRMNGFSVAGFSKIYR